MQHLYYFFVILLNWGKNQNQNHANIFSIFKSHKSQREHDVQKKKDELEEIEKEKKRLRLPKNKSEAQNREEGLQRAIEPTNKGFEMLKKMGYKEGMHI